MPIRVKSKKLVAERDPSPSSVVRQDVRLELPYIAEDDSFRNIIKKLAVYFTEAIVIPSTPEQLRTTSAGESLRTLVDHLSVTCTNPAIVNALLALKWHYDTAQPDPGLSSSRAAACEIVAWRFLTRLTEREAVEYALYEIPDPHDDEAATSSARPTDIEGAHEQSPLVVRNGDSVSRSSSRRSLVTGSTAKRSQLLQSLSSLTMYYQSDEDEEDDPTSSFVGLNALEIAAVADAKKFLSQHIVQKIITGIWNGDIIFWDSLAVHSTKKPRYYNETSADPFSRLRVPKYLKMWEVFFFAIFMFLYYSVLIDRNPEHISVLEYILYVWLAAFLHDEISSWIDAGSVFYTSDVWNIFDVIMICIGFVFAALRITGIVTGNSEMVELSFDILALEALFMVPRIGSILSLSPYWGTLVPCLKEMGKDFIKFMVLVVIIYLGFLTTFSLIGRDSFSFPKMAMIITKIFFGGSAVGFDVMDRIDPFFGPPLMITFVTLSSILLMGSLTGMLSNSFSRVITHAREEYLYVYSVYVLEASTSNRLTHFYPPFNLLALVIFRPLRLFLPNDERFRAARIALLRATHFPIVGTIKLYEAIARHYQANEFDGMLGGPRSETIQAKPGRPHTADQRPSSSRRPKEFSPRNSAEYLAAHRPVSSRAAEMALAHTESPEQEVTVESQINELTQKIDRLTALVLSLQEGRQASSSTS